MSSSASPTTSYAHSAHAEARRQEKARTLARWCYDRGIDARILDVAPDRLRLVARQAGVTPPHHEASGSPTWELVAYLFTQREAWDRAHGVVPPPRADCVDCAIDQAPCSSCEPQLPMPTRTRSTPDRRLTRTAPRPATPRADPGRHLPPSAS
jgi:hypothetical protein